MRLTEVSVLLLDVPTLDFCLGEQRKGNPERLRVRWHAWCVVLIRELWDGKGPGVAELVDPYRRLRNGSSEKRGDALNGSYPDGFGNVLISIDVTGQIRSLPPRPHV